jgi:hypothetical protein
VVDVVFCPLYLLLLLVPPIVPLVVVAAFAAVGRQRRLDTVICANVHTRECVSMESQPYRRAIWCSCRRAAATSERSYHWPYMDKHAAKTVDNGCCSSFLRLKSFRAMVDII